MDPIPVGTVVIRISDGKRYVIIAHDRPEELFRTSEIRQMLEEGLTIEGSYPDGVAYQIFPEGMSRKFGNLRDYTVFRVRRKSLTEADT